MEQKALPQAVAAIAERLSALECLVHEIESFSLRGCDQKDAMINRLLCLFNRHQPDRNRVKWDGLDYLATCRSCGKPIRRIRHKLWHERD